MRGSTIKVGEFLTAKYYDLIPKIENNKVVKVNGKIEYELSTIPYEFTYREKETGSGALFFNTFKGFQNSLSNLGVFQVREQNYSIYTSCTEIPFKVGGSVVINYEGREYKLIVVNKRNNTLYQNNLVNARLGTIDMEHTPILLDLA